MPEAFEKYAWPLDDLDRAVTALCRSAGYELTPATDKFVAPKDDCDASIELSIRQIMGQSRVECDSMEPSFADIELAITESAPAMLPIQASGESRMLLILKSNRRSTKLLCQDETERSLATDQIVKRIAEPLMSAHQNTLDQVMERIEGSSGEYKRMALARELCGNQPLRIGWQIKLAPTAPLRSQASELGIPKLLIATVVAAMASSGLWVVSWWLLGGSIFAGRLDAGWLAAWMLAIITMIPFRILVTKVSGRATVLAGAIIKRRLMYGAVHIDSAETKTMGTGKLLGQVLESEVLDTVAVSGGFLALLAAVDLVLAFFVLSFGAAAWSLIVLLGLILLASSWLMYRFFEHRDEWTQQRQQMTDDLIEKMQGHRTRLIQQPKGEWNHNDDQRLSRYVTASERLDRQFQGMRVGLPRTWMVIALCGLAGAFVYGDATSTGLAITIGGILLVYFALQNLMEAGEKLIAAAIAWRQVQPLWQSINLTSSPVLLDTLRELGDLETNVLETNQLCVHVDGHALPLLDKIELKVNARDRIRVTGETGCGKSVLATVLAGIQGAQKGSIQSSGIDRQTYGDRWQQRIGFATSAAQNHLLLGTLAYNVLLGQRWPALESDLQFAERVCRRMGLGPLLDRMPCGIHQIVGETGWQLSHGERCRVFAARAILQNPEVVILDGLLSSLDPATQSNVLSELEAERFATMVVENN